MKNEHKQKLQEERARLTAELEKVARRDPETGEWEVVRDASNQSAADSNNQADLMEGFEENSALMNELEARYFEVETALSKMEDGEYGTCDVCGNPIEEGRLDANPAAQTCMEHMNS